MMIALWQLPEIKEVVFKSARENMLPVQLCEAEGKWQLRDYKCYKNYIVISINSLKVNYILC